MRKSFVFLSSFLILSPMMGHSVNYISSPPLKSVVKSSVSSCEDTRTVQLPFISWGGDIATILANGNQKTTKNGSLFDQSGLKFNMVREDIFSKQVEAYLTCQSPYLRGTMGMINLAAPLTENDPRTKMKIIYQMTWSTGGDAMVVKENIKRPKDLKGKIIAVQAYGPHVDYLAKILADSGLSMKDVNIRWTKDLTGTDETPLASFYNDDVDAAMVIIPDALALTAGKGKNKSVKGAKILLTTKTASRVIADVYAVRQDYYENNKKEVEKFVKALLKAQEDLEDLMKNKNSSTYKKMIRASAKLLLGSPQSITDTKKMYVDAQYVGVVGNKKFFTQKSYPRNFEILNNEIQSSFQTMGLVSKKLLLGEGGWDYTELSAGLRNVLEAEAPRFDSHQVAKMVAEKQKQNTLSKDSLFSFEVFFGPNQKNFSERQYEKAFNKVIKLASTYGGALITVEGHSDPMGYLRKKKDGKSDLVLSRIKQSAKNLSVARANAVRDSVVLYAKHRGFTLDTSQFAVVGHGIEKPRSGLCEGDPCSPKNEAEWLGNMRVEFRIIQVETEESVFQPL